MKLIDDVNRVTAVLPTEQWTVRGWPKGMAMFHTNNCQCCNEYVAHTVRACKDEGMNLPRQAISNAITTAWPELMRDLERNAEARTANDYEALEDDVVRLKTKLESSQSALASERSRVKRLDETIRKLRNEIKALKRHQSTMSTTTSSTQHGAQATSSAGPSSRPKAPLPVRAQSGLAARISQPGLSSRLDDRPAADHFDDPPNDPIGDTSQSGAPIPSGWSDPGWASDDSIWTICGTLMPRPSR
jgi:polyhydroxyalkanoate synthesis regulator phasin